jgi:phosphoglycolate phosphatase
MLIFWDIDGTLLTTGRAGVFAWEEALRDFTGLSVDLQQFDTAGHADHGIARRLLSEYAGEAEPAPARVAELVQLYEDRLPAALHRRTGRVLPNVREILERLVGEPGTRSLLLTGNTRRGALAKLLHYGLLKFLDDGGFSELDGERATIAHAAIERAAAAASAVPRDPVYVIGDTPHDLRCAAAIAARSIGVATGRYTPAELAALAPWRVLPQLPAPGEFLALLNEREVLADG